MPPRKKARHCHKCGKPIVAFRLHRPPPKGRGRRNPSMDGIMSVCHPACYSAQGPVCTCKCGGMFHGGG